jgi:hypothetical protein
MKLVTFTRGGQDATHGTALVISRRFQHDSGAVPTRCNSHYASVFALALLLCSSACSRRSSEVDRSSGSASPSVRESKRLPPLPSAKPPAPPASPASAPQLVACGAREFYRISPRSLDVFEVAEQLPPPQIRGSRVARQTNAVEIAEPLNLVPLANESVLVIAESGVFRYEAKQRQTKRHAAIPLRGPLLAFPDPKRPDAFWIRSVGEDKSEHYTFDMLALSDGGSPSKSSGATGLVPPTQPALPAYAASVPGVLIDTATEGDRVAVLSLELRDDNYQPTVVIFTGGKEQARLTIGPSIGLKRQPKLDLCVMVGRPWVLVGNGEWLQLLDWSSRRLLSEW